MTKPIVEQVRDQITRTTDAAAAVRASATEAATAAVSGRDQAASAAPPTPRGA